MGAGNEREFIDHLQRKEGTIVEQELVKLPSEDEIKEWISKSFGHLNPDIAPYIWMGIEALYVKLGGKKFITIT